MKPNCSKHQRAGGRGHWLGGLSLGALALALAAAVAHGEIVFDNTASSDGNTKFKVHSLVETGDEVLLHALAPVSLTSFSFEYYGLHFRGTEQVRLRFYGKDPASLGPGALLYDSGWGGVPGTTNPPSPCTLRRCFEPFIPGASLPGASYSSISNGAALEFTDFITGAVVPLGEKLPVNFIWTVEFQGLAGASEAGFLVAGKSPEYLPRHTLIIVNPQEYVWGWKPADVGENIELYWQRFNSRLVLLAAFDENQQMMPINFRARIEGDVAAQFLPPAREEQGLLLTLVGKTGSQYRIQSSTNLVHWSEMQTNTATNGIISTPVPAAGDFRFYRALLVE